MNDKSKRTIEGSLLSSITGSEVSNITKEIGEMTIDSFLENGVLRDIPIVGFLFSLNNARITITDHLFLKKVIGFLEPLGKYTEAQRAEYFKSLDEEETLKAVECMTLYLDKLDNFDKSKMLGRVFELYMTGEINLNNAMYFSHFIDAVFIIVWQDFKKAVDDALRIQESEKNIGFHPQIQLDDALALERVGFYEIKVRNKKGRIDETGYAPIVSSQRVLVLTSAGWTFIRAVLGLEFASEELIYVAVGFEVEIDDEEF